MSVPADRTWIALRYPNPRVHPGIKAFLDFAKKNLPGIKKIKCPCTLCGNNRISRAYDEVELHLIKNGFTPTYTFWNFHGETATNEVAKNNTLDEAEYNDIHVDDVGDAFTNQIFEDGSGNLGVDSEIVDKMHEFEGIDEDSSCRQSTVVEEFMKELYPGSESTVGSFSVRLFDLKVKHGISDRGFSDILKMFKEELPPQNEVPSNKYHAGKVIGDVSLGYEKIHACRNDCILYWGKYSDLEMCPTCNAPRYKIEKDSNKYRRRVPAKVLWYFPITPRLKRMYSVPWVAKEMTWHTTGRMPAGKMGHPVDSSVWKSLDSQYPDFSVEPRNVRLGLATDGFNPFGSCSSSYSCWPVMCVPFNLPPNLCMKPEFTMLSLIIEGPRQPGDDIDVFLQPLVKELEDLWDNGDTVFDAASGENFNMRAALLWTIHDFPAYGNISGCRTKGIFACPICGPNIDSLRLRYGKKHVYGNFRRWLPLTDELRSDTSPGTFNSKTEFRRQPLRLEGIEVENMTSKLKVQWGKSKKRKRGEIEEGEEDEHNNTSNCYTKRSIFFNLKYWKHIHVRHNLDVMHIEKNVCEILIALMLNTKKKTKDDANARRDLKHLKLKKSLWLKVQKGNLIRPSSRVWLRKEEKKLFLQTLKDLRVPIGFSSNWKNLVTDDKLDLKCLKSHDYHILMQHLLPMLIQHAYKDRKEVRQIIRGFSTFFNALCSRIIDVETLSVLERGMVRTLCELERICPPSVFVIMMHLPIHLAYEARVCGPVYYRWMYPFERFMKTFKGYVGNKARPEACVAERYIKEEAIIYCKSYRREGDAVFKQVVQEMNDQSCKGGDDDDESENSEGSVLFGSGKKFVLPSSEYEQARRWVLKSHPSYDLWQKKYAEARKGSNTKKPQKVSKDEDFIVWLKHEVTCNTDLDFVDIVQGPKHFAKRYKKCCINGFLFVTKDFEENKRYQNSGVCTKSVTTCRSSAKDKAPIDESMEYYGILRDIIQLEYHRGYTPVLFKCDWVKVTRQGVKWDEEANLRLVNLSNTIRKDQLTDEPFILAEHAQQVFYSRDPVNPEWHVVLEVPQLVYVDDDETCILSPNQPILTDGDVGPSNSEPVLEELIFQDPDDAGVVVKESQKKKQSRKK